MAEHVSGPIHKALSAESENAARAFTFEEAFKEAKFGRFNYYVIFVSGLIMAYALVELATIGYVMPIFQCDLSLTESEKGILGATAFAGAITSAQIWGYLADTLGRRRVLIPSLFLSFLSSVLSSLSGQFWPLLIFRFCAGFFGPGGSSVVYAYLGEFHGSKHRSRAILGASFVFGCTYVFIPIVAWLVISQDWVLDIPYLAITYKPWRLFFVICGLPGLISSLCLLTLPESPKFLLSQGRENEAIAALKRVYSINTGKSGDNFMVHYLTREKEGDHNKTVFDKNNPIKSLLTSLYNQTAPIFKKEYIRITILASSIQFGTYLTCNGLYVWFFGIANQLVMFMSSNPGNSATICEVVYSNLQAAKEIENSDKCTEQLELGTYTYTLSLEVLYMIGYGVMGFVINAAGAIPVLFAISVCTGFCGIVITFVNIPWLSIVLYAALILCGLNIGVIYAVTVDLYPTPIRSMALCITLMIGRVGSLVGSNIVGLLIENHCETAFLLSGISLIVCGFLAFLIPKPTIEVEPAVDYVESKYSECNTES